jgi:hypothetical protein
MNTHLPAHPLTLDENSDHFARLIVDRERRAGICRGLIHLAQATPFEKRQWFSIVEVANAHAREANTLVVNPQKHAAIVEGLRASIERRELVDERNRLQVMNICPSSRAGFRFDPDAARNSDWFKKSIEFVLIRRDVLLSWCRQFNVLSPAELCLGEKSPDNTDLASAANKEPTTERKNKAGAKAQWDWAEIEMLVCKTMDERGDFAKPENAEDGWRSLADLYKQIVKYVERLPPAMGGGMGNGPAESTLKGHVPKMVAEWREQRRN